MVITVTNITSASIPVGNRIGMLAPNAARTLELTSSQAEDLRPVLVRLASAGMISWSVASNTDTSDDGVEFLSKQQLEDGTLAADLASLTVASPVVLGSVRLFSGTGSPEGSVAAPVGSLYLRSNGGAGTTFYVKESGTGNTGWVAK
jgi:hypothetical protein